MATAGTRAPDLNGVHVLVVDDEAQLCAILERVLTHFGAAVSCAASPADALNILKGVVAHVVVTDLQMPGHDGRWLLRQLRADASRPHLPVLLITASQEMDETKATRAGFDGYIRKPIDVSQLAHQVERLARRVA